MNNIKRDDRNIFKITRIMTPGKRAIARRAIYKRCKQSIAIARNRCDIYKAITQLKKELSQVNYNHDI